MSREQRTGQAAMTGELRTEAHGPRWRALLEARWQARLRELTELSLAYHVAIAAVPASAGAGFDGAGFGDGPEAQGLLRRTVAARRKLADVEEALTRLAAGEFGRCEQCGARLPDGLLAAAPELRYCARCDGEPSWVRPLAGRTGR
jgi:RNA polymerase-binding transcription factor